MLNIEPGRRTRGIPHVVKDDMQTEEDARRRMR